MVRRADEECADRRRDHDRRRRVHAKRAEAADHNRRVHRVDSSAASRFHRLVIASDKIRPVELVRLGNDRGRETITVQRHRHPKIEIFVFDNPIVVQHETAKGARASPSP